MKIRLYLSALLTLSFMGGNMAVAQQPAPGGAVRPRTMSAGPAHADSRYDKNFRAVIAVPPVVNRCSTYAIPVLIWVYPIADQPLPATVTVWTNFGKFENGDLSNNGLSITVKPVTGSAETVYLTFPVRGGEPNYQVDLHVAASDNTLDYYGPDVFMRVEMLNYLNIQSAPHELPADGKTGGKIVVQATDDLGHPLSEVPGFIYWQSISRDVPSVTPVVSDAHGMIVFPIPPQNQPAPARYVLFTESFAIQGSVMFVAPAPK